MVRINDTKKENNLIVHFTDELPEDLTKAFVAKVDTDKRRDTANNHSATHLLHAALKRVLGDHVNQKGSLVNEEYLRFDFSHFAKVTDEEIAAIEKIVNEKIRENIKLDEQRKVPFQQAIDSGVTALFGEKYGDFVRVITFDPSYSKELCGGIHVPATGQIGSFKIVAESAVAAGVRRIEAITATKAEELYNQQQAIVNEVKTLLKNPKDVVKGLENVLEENNRLRKELEQMIIQKASMLKDDLVKKAESINGVNFIATRVDIPSAEAIKNLSFEMREKLNDLFLVIAAEIDGKPSISVIISDSLVQDKKLNASQIVRELGKEIQGGGGGQPFYATAGGKDASGLDRALEKAKQYLS
ncbi:Alanine--tRNA ligase [compost metagenome]